MQIRTTGRARDRLEIIRPEASEEDGTDSLASVVRRGLMHAPKFMPCRFLYDAIGSELFERICSLPEYYPTRTEDAILRDWAAEMVVGWAEATTMIELGSGSSTKTRRLIEAALQEYGRLHYVPIDVSEIILEQSARALIQAYPRLSVTGVVADYDTALRAIAGRFPGPKLVVFLGSSLGNFDDEDAVGLLRNLSETIGPEDRLLVGLDLIKDAAVLEAAYDDAEGITAQFGKNLLRRINRELGADFDLDRFGYRARFEAARHRVEIHLVSLRDQVVTIPGAEMVASFAEGETIHIENSHKYTPELIRELASRSGFIEEESWTDPGNLFRVQRWRPRD
ncbi:L-histidine N(alpha)-methyltransferase [Tautonia sociabilis]|uniref:L-histidine N(alpha)-methyltransferase n=1 Tax=Tautonia sociabilis TaxID=2080755 RepID=UPI001F3C092A|nr:L-histidine N(alpha)-methyltransferase [Tautonia sociabilis]